MLDKIVDAHHHLWDLSTVNYPWLMEKGVRRFFGDPTPIQKDYRVFDFEQDIGGLPVTKSVHIQVGAAASDTIKETRWLQSQSTQSPTGLPHAIVGFCDLSADDAQGILDTHSECPNFRGIRQILGRNPEEDVRHPTGRLLNDSNWLANLSSLSELGLSFDLQLIPEQIPSVARILASLPDLQVALCHAGSPHDLTDSGLRTWQRGMQVLAQLPNVHCKLSGFCMFAQNWRPERVKRISLTAIDAFGVDRCMFASNFPVEKLYVNYAQLYECYLEVASGFSNTQQAALFSGNALRFYRI